MTRPAGHQSFIIHLYDKGKSGVSNHKIEGFTETDIETLKDEGYITLSRSRASLKAKALLQYKLHKNQIQSTKMMSHETYLSLLVKAYKTLGDNRRKSVNLAVVLEGEGLTPSQLESVMEYMVGEGWVEAMSDEGLDVYFKHLGIKAAESFNLSTNNTTSEASNMTTPKDPRKVFVVHGRNLEARNSLFRFLRSIELKPLEWSQAIRETGKASPFIGEILDVAFSKAQAVVVLLSPDDEAQLCEPFRSASDPPYESQLTGQARPNVLFEAGMAMGRNPDRTIIVELGTLRPFSDIAGRHTVRLNNGLAARQELAQRLETAGCPAELTGRDWHTEGDFNFTLENEITKPGSQNDKKARRRYLRERLGEFFSEGDRIFWGIRTQQVKSHREHDLWLKQVEEYLSLEPEFDNSHIARFKAEQLVAIKEFIKELSD